MSPTRDGRRGEEFDFEWRYGRPAELLVQELCGLADAGKIRVEVKHKRRDDAGFYVELEHDKGHTGVYEPSGFAISDADVWAFAIADTGVVVMARASHIRTALERNYGRPAAQREGSCPTRGRLLSAFDLISAALPRQSSRADFGDDFAVNVR